MKTTVSLRNIFLKMTIVLFALSVLLLVLNSYSTMQINNVIAHFIVFFIAVAALPVFMGVWLHFKTNWLLAVLFSALAICFVIAFLNWGGDWKTQTVIYRNKSNPRLTVEFRMRGDRFSFGYKKQTIRRLKLMPYIDLVENADLTLMDTSEWKLVNEKINELHIPGEYADTLSE